MKYSYEFEIKYQEVDDRKKLRLFNLENYLLEVAGKVADELGFGIAQLHPMGLTWIITRLSLEMTELPGPTDHIRIETWVEGTAHMLSTRDFRIYKCTKDNVQCTKDEWKLIGKCKSVWAILDMEKREIANVFDMPMFEGHVDGEVLDMTRTRMTTLPEPTGSVPHKIVYSDLDYNRHCNSCKYLQAMLDAYLPDYYGKTVRLDINYSKEVMLGDELMTHYLILEDGVQYQQKNEAGDTSCSAKITIV